MTTVALPVADLEVRPLRRAGFVSRSVADVVDFAIVWLLSAFALVGIALGRYLVTSKPFEVPRPNLGVTSTAEFLLLTAYLAWGWASTGRTPGKALLGLRVVTNHGGPLSVGRATARAAICVLFPIFLVWALVSRRDAGIHDLLLSTAVVYDWEPRAVRR